jgi:type VI secretion system protein ImpH
METKSRNQGNNVIDLLFAEAYRFDFYQAVKLLEMLYLKAMSEKREKPNKQTEEDFFTPENFPVQFNSSISASFAASDIEKVALSEKKNEVFEMIVNFIGLAGIQGPLPYHYTQLIIDSEKESQGNKAFREFLDIFNNRMALLLYQTRKVHRVTFDLNQPEETQTARYLFSLLGMGSEGLKNRLSVKDETLLYYTGLLASQSRSLAGIEFILSDYFGVNVHAVSFVGIWQCIPADQRIKLGLNGVSQILGSSATIGKKYWNPTAKFEIRIGPVSGKQYLQFLPLNESEFYTPLYELTRHYSGPEYNFDFILIVNPADLTPVKLGDKKNARLGWTTWIPQKTGSIFDYEYLLFVETNETSKTRLSTGERIRMGWTVWVPDTSSGEEYIEVRLSTGRARQGAN